MSDTWDIPNANDIGTELRITWITRAFQEKGWPTEKDPSKLSELHSKPC